MKKIIALIGLSIVLSNFSHLSAQLYLGGSISLNGSTYESLDYYSDQAREYSNNYVRISPQVGYFLNDKFLIGMSVGFGNYKSTSESEDIHVDTVYIDTYERGSRSIVIDPFIRHYISLGEKFSLYNQLGVRYSFGKNDYEDLNASIQRTYNGEVDFSSFTAYLKPSINVSLSDKLSLEFSFIELYYNSYSSNSERWYTYDDPSIIADAKEGSDGNRINYGLKYNNIELGLAYKF